MNRTCITCSQLTHDANSYEICDDCLTKYNKLKQELENRNVTLRLAREGRDHFKQELKEVRMEVVKQVSYIQKIQAKAEALDKAAGMLNHIGCINGTCDGNGVCRDHEGQPSPCQWCDELEAINKAR